jgi:spore germination protein GerM
MLHTTLDQTQKQALIALQLMQQKQLEQLNSSTNQLEHKLQRLALAPSHQECFQTEIEQVLQLKDQLQIESSQLKKAFKRELIAILSPDQRQTLRTVVQQNKTGTPRRNESSATTALHA